MLDAMISAELGDEQAREDPTVNQVQRRAAELLGHEAALFLPTATMSNQIALRVLTKPGTQLIAEERTHILVYEAGGPAVQLAVGERPALEAARTLIQGTAATVLTWTALPSTRSSPSEASPRTAPARSGTGPPAARPGTTR